MLVGHGGHDVVVAVAVLLAEFGSAVTAKTSAVFDNVPAVSAGHTSVTVTVAWSPSARGPRLQFTSLDDQEHGCSPPDSRCRTAASFRSEACRKHGRPVGRVRAVVGDRERVRSVTGWPGPTGLGRAHAISARSADCDETHIELERRRPTKPIDRRGGGRGHAGADRRRAWSDAADQRSPARRRTGPRRADRGGARVDLRAPDWLCRSGGEGGVRPE